MQYIKGLEAYTNKNSTAVTIGKFDGLHLGHELLIQKLEAHKKQDDVDSVVLTFDMTLWYQTMHISQENIMTNDQRAEHLKDRVDYLVECPLSSQISGMSAEDFIREILVEKFHARFIVVGTDFTFGYQKKGDWRMLKKYESVYGYHVDVLEKKCYKGREISSTYVREAIKQGDFELAEALLGYSYKSI